MMRRPYNRVSPVGLRPRGFTIFIAALVTSLALAIGLAIYDLTVRELNLSATANQSQYAIYAADSGAECALYWDSKCTLSGCQAGSAFATSTDSAIPGSGAGMLCNGTDMTTTWTTQIAASAATTTLIVKFTPQPYCAYVTVAKSGTPTQTTVTSHGYNTCDAGAPIHLERALQVTY